MRIAFINQSPNYITFDIIKAFEKNGFNAELWGCFDANVVNRDNWKPLQKYDRKSNYTKLRSWVLGFLQIIIFISKSPREQKLVAFSNPPFNLLLGLIFPNRILLVVYDVYPEVLYALKILRRESLVYKVFELLTATSYSRFKSVSSISESLSNSVQKNCGKVVQNFELWGNTNEMFNEQIELPASNGKSIKLLIAGNIGASHDVHIFRKFIEWSVQQEHIELYLSTAQLEYQSHPKIHQLGFIPESQYGSFLSQMDWALVVQNSKVGALSLPSRVYNYFASALPVLAFCGRRSALWNVVSEIEAGVCFDYDQMDFSGKLEELLIDPSLSNTCKEKLHDQKGRFSSDQSMKFVDLITNAETDY